MLSWLDDPHEVIHLAGRALAWINDMVSQSRADNPLPRIAEPSVGIAPAYSCSHRYKIALGVHHREVRLFGAVLRILVAANVNSEWQGHPASYFTS
jgi:hypothetical protein